MIAEAEVRSWALFAWSVAAYTIGCGVLMWLNQRRVGVAMTYFDRSTSAIFSGQVLALGALSALACWFDLGRGVHGAFLVAGALAVPITGRSDAGPTECSAPACRPPDESCGPIR